MKLPKPAINYKKFRLKKLNTPEFKHLKLLFFWPIFGLLFYAVESLYLVRYHFPVYCSWDNLIPFNEWFLLPYFYWYIFLAGMHIYTLLFDVDNFKKMMKYIIISYTAALVIYIIFPNCQQLRPLVFVRDNVLTRVVRMLYAFDTNTNVCPSIHVIGSMAVLAAALRIKTLTKTDKALALLSALLISVSTVFLKQHSVIDIIAALPICWIADMICYGAKNKRKMIKH